MNNNSASNKRFYELDVLRGLASMSVVLYHFTFVYSIGLGQISDDKFHFNYGYLGVPLFFIISGYVIFMTLEKTEKSTDFIVSRFSRLYPAYWASIIVTIITTTLLSAPFQQELYSFDQVLINFTMLQYFFKIQDIDGVYWSLAVELTFYFIMWFIFMIKKLHHINWFCLGWLILSVAFTFIKIPFENYIKFILDLNYAPLFIGGIAFYNIKKDRTLYSYHIIAILSLLSEYYLFHLQEIDQAPNIDGIDFVPYVVITLFYGLFYLFIFNKLTFLTNKFFIFLGSISYPLYLIHQNIGRAIIYWLRKIVDIQFIYLPITLLIVVALASLITFKIEKPALKAIRFFYSNKYDFLLEKLLIFCKIKI